jgi:hypothetical protein
VIEPVKLKPCHLSFFMTAAYIFCRGCCAARVNFAQKVGPTRNHVIFCAQRDRIGECHETSPPKFSASGRGLGPAPGRIADRAGADLSNQVIILVVAVAAGGPPHVYARLVAKRLEDHFGSGSILQRNERVKLAASFWNNVGANFFSKKWSRTVRSSALVLPRKGKPARIPFHRNAL